MAKLTFRSETGATLMWLVRDVPMVSYVQVQSWLQCLVFLDHYSPNLIVVDESVYVKLKNSRICCLSDELDLSSIISNVLMSCLM